MHTGQHYDDNMSDIFFRDLGLRAPDSNLQVGSGSHAEQTASMLLGLESLVRTHAPDWVIVYGDTNSTLAGVLAASKLGIPVAHVEAGLRSFNRRMPEEINRIVADALADVLFTPCRAATLNLQREGMPSERILQVGDVMYDAARLYCSQTEGRGPILKRLNVTSYVLATIHRAANTNDEARLLCIWSGLARLAERIPVVWPVHPRTRLALDRMGHASTAPAGLHLTEPAGYLEMARLERQAAAIVTDSGGVQKEAFFWEVPCVTLRTETEWTELIELGWNRLCPPAEPAAIANSVLAAVGTRGRDGEPYGDGHASERIVQHLCGATGSLGK